MNDVELRLAEVKKVLKPFNVLALISLVIVILGAIFLILGVAIKGNAAIDRLFAVGIGLFCASVVFALSIGIVARKQYDEYNRLKKELKKQNK